MKRTQNRPLVRGIMSPRAAVVFAVALEIVAFVELWLLVNLLSAVLAVSDALNEPRYPSLKGIMGAKKKPQEVVSLADLGVPADRAGEAGSRTAVNALNPPPSRGDTLKIEDDGSAAQKVLEYLIERKLV